MIDNSYLLGLFGGASTFGTSTSVTSALTAAATKKQPTPPWDASAVVPPESDRVRAALGGRRIIDEAGAKLDLAGASADYRKLFALYQGLDTLIALTNRAATKGLSQTDLSLLTKRFASGLAEVGAYVGSADLDALRLVQGTSSAISKSTAAVPRDSAKSITAPIHEGSVDSEVAAFTGDVAFNITIKTPVGDLGELTTTTVPIDLSNLGSAPRTFDNVLTYINDQLKTAGVETRLGREQIKAEPKTLTTNGKTITLPAGPNQWALAIRAGTLETVGFTADQTADAVYVVQGAGTTGGQQLLKFQTDVGGTPPATEPRVGETQWVDGRASQTALPDGVSAIRASATAPDGSVWLVGDITEGSDNQPIKGQSDVALFHYDPAGRLIATRALGAASNASGYALAISDEGKIAVAGSVTGALDQGKSGDVATVADSFVTVFDARGQELWTQRRGARAADEATAVSFGPDGQVIVAGRSQSAIPGASTVGGWDGYLQTFSASQIYPGAPYVAVALSATQFGTGGDDSIQATAVDGSDLYTAGVEDGHAVVRKFTLDGDGRPVLAATRDLGLASGEIAGISVSGGKIILAGTTRNDALDAGTITSAHSGGTDVFVASLSTDLAVSSSDRLTYYGGAGDDTAADVKVQDGKVWVTGVSDRAIGAKATDPTQAYLARLDPETGAVEWSRTWAGDGQQASPATLAVSSGGASVLDRLGLPQGDVAQGDSKLLTAATSVRAGDKFYVTPPNGGRAIAVTIEARDTLQSLARKIEQASNMKLKVTVASEGGYVTGKDGEITTTAGGFQRLSVTARDGQTGAVLTAGEPGRDALAGLGLSPGFIGASGGDKSVKTFGLDLPANLNLNNAASIKTAGEALQAALKVVRDAYRALAPQTTSAAASGPVPAYLTNQLANYQAALARLTG